MCPHFVEDKFWEVKLPKVKVSLSHSQVPTLQPLFQKLCQWGSLWRSASTWNMDSDSLQRGCGYTRPTNLTCFVQATLKGISRPQNTLLNDVPYLRTRSDRAAEIPDGRENLTTHFLRKGNKFTITSCQLNTHLAVNTLLGLLFPLSPDANQDAGLEKAGESPLFKPWSKELQW